MFADTIHAVVDSSSVSSSGPVDSFFPNLTHYSCWAVNELVPHVSLALACDLYFPGCFICLFMSTMSLPALLLWLPVCSPRATAAPSQLEGPSWCAATTSLLGSTCPRAQGLSLRGDWHQLLVMMDAHLTSSDSGIFFQAVTLFEQITFV